MSIVSSIPYNTRNYSATQHKYTDKHTDHLGINYYVSYINIIGFDRAARLAVDAIRIDQQTKDTEIAKGINTYENGGDPLHYDAGYWAQVTPDYQTWDDLATAVTINFLERENQLELIYIETVIIRISSADKRRIWGMDNTQVSDVNAAIQVAVDTKVSLSTYSPFFIEGVLQ